MTQAELFPTPGKIQAGCSVRVTNLNSRHCGRTGRVETPAPQEGEARGKRWKVVFEWPTGGLAGGAVFLEDELEIIPRL